MSASIIDRFKVININDDKSSFCVIGLPDMLFHQLTHFLETGEELPGPSLQERAAVIIRHLDLLLKYKGEYVGPREMRKHATWYTRGITHGAILRDRFNKAATREDFKAILDEFFGGYSAE